MAECAIELVKALQLFIYSREICDTLKDYKENAVVWFSCQNKDETRI